MTNKLIALSITIATFSIAPAIAVSSNNFFKSSDNQFYRAMEIGIIQVPQKRCISHR